MPKNGTMLAILKDGSHVTLAGVSYTPADFRAAIQLHTKAVWREVADIIIAYGDQVDRFGPGEFCAHFGQPLPRFEHLTMCPTCDGTGEVHSHNPICPTCRGRKVVPKDVAATAPKV